MQELMLKVFLFLYTIEMKELFTVCFCVSSFTW